MMHLSLSHHPTLVVLVLPNLTSTTISSGCVFSIKLAFIYADKKFKDAGIKSASLDARLLLSFALNQSTSQLFTNQNYILTKTEEENFYNLVNRRINLEPIAYIIGEKEFYSNKFLINKDVLIPRPDTELLVDIAINKYKHTDKKSLNFLELGTGSGCIIISLLLALSTIYATATDISLPALSIAQQNAKLHSVENRLTLIESNWFNDIKNQKFDLIISNPPYIANYEKEFMSYETILYEPTNALFADSNGLYNYKQIALHAFNYLSIDGEILVEIGFNQLDDVISIFLSEGYIAEEIYKDINNINRAICFKKSISKIYV